MYEKKIDGVMQASKVLGVIGTHKKHLTLFSLKSSFVRRLAYLLCFVLFLLLVTLTIKTIVLFPRASDLPPLNEGCENAVSPEARMMTSVAIVPSTAVYYHGEKLGDYQNEGATVAQALESFGISLGKNDVINYNLDENLYFGMSINIDEVRYSEAIVKTVIPYDIVEIESQTVPKGERVVATEGVMGLSQKVIKSKYVNGELEEEAVADSTYIEPVNEVIHIGVGGVFTAPDGTEYNYSYYLDVTATAYTHTGDPTYMGTVAEVGVIAVDPRNIDLGSDVYVIGNYGDYGLCRAEDIGGGIKGKRIDVFLDTEEECVQFGRRKMRAYIIEK